MQWEWLSTKSSAVMLHLHNTPTILSQARSLEASVQEDHRGLKVHHSRMTYGKFSKSVGRPNLKSVLLLNSYLNTWKGLQKIGSHYRLAQQRIQ